MKTHYEHLHVDTIATALRLAGQTINDRVHSLHDHLEKLLTGMNETRIYKLTDMFCEEIMKTDISAIIRGSCNDPDCGMISAWRVFRDGSFLRIHEACWHGKIIPSRDQIIEIINNSGRCKHKNSPAKAIAI